MGQGLSTSVDVIRQRLTVLEDLVGVLDRQVTPLNTAIGLQSTAMWTSIPSCSGFATEYAGRLGTLQQGAVALLSQVAGLQATLSESAASLTRVDQDIQDRLTALAARLADVPALPHTSDPTSTASSTQPAGGGTW